MYVLADPRSYGYAPNSYPIVLPSDILAAARINCGIAIKELAFSPVGIGNRVANLPLEELLLCTGLATTSAVSYKQPRAWGFLLEHAETFANHKGRLRVVPSVTDWDSHQVGSFSDRMGMGAAAWALWRHYQVVHLADAGPFIGAALAAAPATLQGKWLKILGKHGKHGKLKPDFFCLDAAGAAVVAEAKGGVCTPGVLGPALKKGKKQVQNVAPHGVPLRAGVNRLVFALNLRHAGETRARASADSAITVLDPEGDDDVLQVPVREDSLVRAAYAKILSFTGHRFLASILVQGDRPLFDEDIVREAAVRVADQPVFPLMSGPGVTLGLHSQVAIAVLASTVDGFQERVRDAVGRMEMPQRWQEGFSLPNGLVINFGSSYGDGQS